MLSLALVAAMATTARAPAPKNRPYDVRHYRIELDLDEASGRFAGRVGITLTPSRALDEVTFDCVGLHVNRVTRRDRGQPIDVPLAYVLRADPEHPDDGTLTVTLAS